MHGRICIVTTQDLSWLTGIDKLEYPDLNPHNKDANIIDKVLSGVQHLKCNDFVICLDDFAFTSRCDLRMLPVLFNNRKQNSFGPNYEKKEWRNMDKKSI